MNTLHILTQYAQNKLKNTYSIHEIQAICKIIYIDIFNYTNIDIHLKKDECLAESFVNKFHSIVEELGKGKPIQYIIGEAEFAGRRFRLNSATLIPRPETEELVRWMAGSAGERERILDIGSGSGCIAISAAAMLKDATVSGIDISAEAIAIAQENAVRNRVAVNFSVKNILEYPIYTWEHYDVIISNPPYVREGEKALMHSRVLDHEPGTALFVPDSDPLIFYRTIAAFGRKQLVAGGTLFFEINEQLGEACVALMEQSGYSNVVLKKDLFEKDRFIKCQLL